MGQLYWREFFYLVSAKTENFDKIVGNPLCLKIDWWLQAGAKASSKEQIAMNHLDAWRNGRTGYPWIDAIMTQLRTEGWIHHLARHSVACFLTRGDLFISWERGVEVFDEFLLDSDWALNNANWMWLRYEKAYLNYSASAFFTQYFRVYSPIAFGKKYDKEGKYIKKYLPVLSKLPPKYIFEPWTAPLNIQKQSGCIIGVDYPKPIVMHDVVSKENMQKMKIAYSHGIRGYKPSEKEEVVDEEDDIITIESDEEPPSKKQRT
jgi:cryptochrome